MLVVLTARQVNEIEVYASVESIMDVSKPKEDGEQAGERPDSVALFERIKSAFKVKPARKGKRP